jgi:hypothetical protein
LGHHDLSTTQRYAYVLDKTVERDYQQAMAAIERSAHVGFEVKPCQIAPVW